MLVLIIGLGITVMSGGAIVAIYQELKNNPKNFWSEEFFFSALYGFLLPCLAIPVGLVVGVVLIVNALRQMF